MEGTNLAFSNIMGVSSGCVTGALGAASQHSTQVWRKGSLSHTSFMWYVCSVRLRALENLNRVEIGARVLNGSVVRSRWSRGPLWDDGGSFRTCCLSRQHFAESLVPFALWNCTVELWRIDEVLVFWRWRNACNTQNALMPGCLSLGCAGCMKRTVVLRACAHEL